MSLKTYAPDQVVVVLAGIVFTGYAKGTFIKCGRENPMYTKGVGSSGEGWRAKSSDTSGKCEVTLLRSSSTNQQLSALAKLDEDSGDGVGAFLMKDNSGFTLFSAEDAWLQMVPEVEFSDEMSDVTWIIDMVEMDAFIGGN